MRIMINDKKGWNGWSGNVGKNENDINKRLKKNIRIKRLMNNNLFMRKGNG